MEEGIWYRRGTSFVCEGREERERQRMSSIHVTEVADWLVLHYAQVVHGPTEGDLDGLTNAGSASFHHFDFVYRLVHAQRNQLGSRKPLPGGGKSIYYNTCTVARLEYIFFVLFFLFYQSS